MNWKWTPEHAEKTLVDVIGFFPGIGVVKYVHSLHRPATPETGEAQERAMQSIRQLLELDSFRNWKEYFEGMEGEETKGADGEVEDGLEYNSEIDEKNGENNPISEFGNKGYQFLIELELGTNLGDYDYIKIDDKGEIISIRNHDVGDGGITVGVGVFVNGSNEERIKY